MVFMLALFCMMYPAAALHMQSNLVSEGLSKEAKAEDASSGTEVERHPTHDADGRLNFLGLDTQASNKPTGRAHVLPAVSEVISSASASVEAFAANAKEMRKQAESMQLASKRNLTLLKAHYQHKLDALKADHEALTRENEELRGNISLVNATNSALEKQANTLRQGVDILHETFLTLQGRVDVAAGFIGDSLNSSEIDGAPEVQVLVSTTPEPTLEAFLLDARRGLGLDSSSAHPLEHAAATPEEDSDTSAALLQVAALSGASIFEGDEKPASAKDPSQMATVLLSTLQKLGVAEHAAQQRLKDSFAKSQTKWVQRNNDLLSEKSRLGSQLHAVIQRRTDLEAARDSLTGTSNLLRLKLVEFVGFLAFLDKAATSAVQVNDCHGNASGSS